MGVHVLVVKDDSDTESYVVCIAVFTTYEKAMAYLAAYCRGHWEQSGQDRPLTGDDTMVVDRYFSFYAGELTYDIFTCELDESLSVVDHTDEFAALAEEGFDTDEE